jgi:hypothetical protein
VTLIRLAGQLLDDERTCVVPDCGAHAAAEPFQAELPAKADELRRKAEAYERLAREARDEAEAIRAEIEAAEPRPYLCAGHRDQLPRDLRGPWETTPSPIAGVPAGGRLNVEPGSEAAAIAQALAAREANPVRYREPRPTPSRNVKRQRRVSPLAGV